jgi:hypothetical protein
MVVWVTSHSQLGILLVLLTVDGGRLRDGQPIMGKDIS